MSTIRGRCSMNTGHACSHQPQVVQAQMVSSGSTPASFETSGGSFSTSSAGSCRLDPAVAPSWPLGDAGMRFIRERSAWSGSGIAAAACCA